jgi:hypothetical protein
VDVEVVAVPRDALGRRCYAYEIFDLEGETPQVVEDAKPASHGPVVPGDGRPSHAYDAHYLSAVSAQEAEAWWRAKQNELREATIELFGTGATPQEVARWLGVPSSDSSLWLNEWRRAHQCVGGYSSAQEAYQQHTLACRYAAVDVAAHLENQILVQCGVCQSWGHAHPMDLAKRAQRNWHVVAD